MNEVCAQFRIVPGDCFKHADHRRKANATRKQNNGPGWLIWQEEVASWRRHLQNGANMGFVVQVS
ncbi:hypothetical protein D3C80_1838120 [compost metagenome]